jgi:hypothetical protein
MINNPAQESNVIEYGGFSSAAPAPTKAATPASTSHPLALNYADFMNAYEPYAAAKTAIGEPGYWQTFGEGEKQFSGGYTGQQTDALDKLGASLKTADGKDLNVGGARSGMSVIPAHGVIPAHWEAGVVNSENGIEGPKQWVEETPATPERYVINTDLSTFLGQDGSNQHAEITYERQGDKLVPVTDGIKGWQWTGNDLTTPIKMAAAMYLMANGIPGMGEAAGTTAGTTVNQSLLSNIMEKGLAQTLGVTNPYIAGTINQGLINSAINGGDLEKGFTQAAIGQAMGAVGGGISKTVNGIISDGTPNFLTNTISNATGAAGVAALTGQDIGDAIKGSLVNTGLNSLNQVVGPAVKDATGSQTAANLAVSGINSIATGGSINPLYVASGAYKDAKEFGGFSSDTTPYIYDPATNPADPNADSNPDLNGEPVVPTTTPITPTTDYSFKPDYGFPTGTNIDDGLKADINPTVDAGNTPVDYAIADTTSGLGLQIPNSPGLVNMGGAQGLTVPTDAGVVSSSGLTPTDHSVVLGDPKSLINNPANLGVPLMPTAPAAPVTTPVTQPFSPTIPNTSTTPAPVVTKSPFSTANIDMFGGFDVGGWASKIRAANTSPRSI